LRLDRPAAVARRTAFTIGPLRHRSGVGSGDLSIDSSVVRALSRILVRYVSQSPCREKRAAILAIPNRRRNPGLRMDVRPLSFHEQFRKLVGATSEVVEAMHVQGDVAWTESLGADERGQTEAARPSAGARSTAQRRISDRS